MTFCINLLSFILQMWPKSFSFICFTSFFFYATPLRTVSSRHLCLSLVSRTAEPPPAANNHTIPLYHQTSSLLVFREVCRLQPSSTSLSIYCHSFCRCCPKSLSFLCFIRSIITVQHLCTLSRMVLLLTLSFKQTIKILL